MKQIENLKSTVHLMGLFHALRFLINGKLVKWTDYSLTDSLFHWQSSKFIRRTIKKCKEDFTLKAKRADVPENVCWVFWYQGFENSPEIVQACKRSVERNLKGFKIILLSSDNLFDYVELPDFIRQKFEKKIIPITQFSDIVRVYLLYFYGGLWLDATIFLTSNLPATIKTSEYFMFKTSVSIKYYLPCQSWFIFAKTKGIESIRKMLDFQLKYWRRENKVKDYFYFFVIVKILMEDDPDFLKSWNDIPYYCDSEPHYLSRQFEFPFDEQKYRHIKSISFCHKLSYKVSDEIKADKTNFYNFILKTEN